MNTSKHFRTMTYSFFALENACKSNLKYGFDEGQEGLKNHW